MHMRAVQSFAMRTTIEITDEQRTRLLEIAGSRGEKGFSGVVREAIDHYLNEEGHRAERVRRALSMRGSFHTSDAAQLEESVRAIRAQWR